MTYVPWNEGASLLGVKRSAFYYLVEAGKIRKEPGRHARDGRYSLEDIEAYKARRKDGKPRRKYRRRPAPVILDWLSPLDIPAILRLDQIVYHEMYLAEAAVYRSWSEKNPQLAMCAFDAKSDRQVMLAYVAALPVEERVILQIMRGEREEIDITKDEIQSYDRPGGYTLLANSAVAHPDRPDLLHMVLRRMMDAWVERYPERYVTRVYSQAVSSRGDQMIAHFFMQPRYDLNSNAYMLDLARPGASRIIRQFQERLELKAPLPQELRQAYTPEPEVSYEQKPRVHVVAERPAPGSAQSLPGGLVSWRSFANLHGISEGTAKKAISSGRLQIVEGDWREGKVHTRGALDAGGRSRFYELYHTNPHWKDCADCPHE